MMAAISTFSLEKKNEEKEDSKQGRYIVSFTFEDNSNWKKCILIEVPLEM